MSVLNIAHRGDPANAPESTLAAFRAAVRIGVDMIEFDVQVTADRHLVVIHDPTVDRTTNGRGAVAGMTLDALRKLDAGAGFDGYYAGQRIPTLAETLEAIPAPLLLNVHIKPEWEDEWLAREVLGLLGQHGALARTLVVHHSLPDLDRFRALDQRLDYCLLPPSDDSFQYVAAAQAAGLRTLQPGRAMMSRAFCNAVHEAGMRANVFYADTERDMHRYIAYGVDGILTDDPGLLAEVLAEPPPR